MKNGVKIQTALLICFLMLPCIIVLFFGMSPGNVRHGYDSDFNVVVNGESVDSEKFLIWTLARYVEPENNRESLKAMAVILRTNLYKALAGRQKIAAEELKFLYYTEEELKEQAELRQEYLQSIRANFRQTLESIEYKD